MAFALTLVKLEEALQAPGCAICRLGREAAARWVEAYLYEHVNDRDARQPILDARGFCPEHTRLLAITEMLTSGPALGVNILYEHLGRVVAGDLRAFEAGIADGGAAPGVLVRLLRRIRGRLRAPGGLTPRGRCPACVQAEGACVNALANLCEEIEKPESSMLAALRASDGICLTHVRIGLEALAAAHPHAARLLIEETAGRLERHSADMREFIRKQNWEYRDEKLTQAEATAWQDALILFTGFPRARFTTEIFQE